MLIFEKSRPGRRNSALVLSSKPEIGQIPRHLLRKQQPGLPQVSELQVVRHYTCLSQKNFSVDTQFYPLGSCTMKYNPRVCNTLSMLPGFVTRHPYAPASSSQGFLACMYELQEMLQDITGMRGVSLTAMAGAQGEFAGVAMIRAYHETRGDQQRNEILVSDAAHGTNPATAKMCGYKIREIPTGRDGNMDIDALRGFLGKTTAGMMLTNPSTLGLMEGNIIEIAQMVHNVGGLLYYDGANLNAILGKSKPADMGFDVIHLNLHKTFATPHGGGGPGAGPVGVSERLLPFLPIPTVGREGAGYRWLTESDRPLSIGRLSAFMGNAGILLRAYIYIRLLGCAGIRRVAEYATLNANYMMVQLQQKGFTVAYPRRRATHEFIITLKPEAKQWGVNARDFAKRLLDYGYHAPTTYFPLIVPECFLIEPTETEDKDTLDGFIDAMVKIRQEACKSPELVTGAPYTLPVKRLDDVKAVRELDLVWHPSQGHGEA